MGNGQDQVAHAPLRVALVGAGIFAREAHLPAWLKQLPRVRIVSVSARTQASAQALADLIPGGAEVELDYARLLARADLDAVDLVLPIDLQPAFIAQALAAGKHVLSEKPAAPTVAQARALLEQARLSGSVWMVAENYRYETAWRRAAELIAEGAIGAPISVTWMLNNKVDAENKYYHTAWRREGSFPGGFLLDGGVHHVAALRLMLGEVESVQAWVRQARADLPPADTLAAALRFASGAVGTYTVTYAAPVNGGPPLEIMGSAGRLRVERGHIHIERPDRTWEETPRARDGVDAEIEAFVAAVLDGAPHLNAPEEALADLAVLEAMLRSAESGRAVHVSSL